MSGQRPNILVIVLDCGRSDRWLGRDRTSVTPVMDRLVREGVSLPTTIAEQSSTTPCFASMLTGTYSTRHGVWAVGGYRMLGDLATLPEVLAQHGYHTYAEMTGPLAPVMGLDRGFEDYAYRPHAAYMDSEWGDAFVERLKGGHYREPWLTVLHLWELHLPRRVTSAFRSSRYGQNTYDRAVSSVDGQLGRVMDCVGANTLTVVTADHGEKTEAEQYQPGTAVDYVTRLYRMGLSGGLSFGVTRTLLGPVAQHQLRVRLQPMLETFSQRETPRALSLGRGRMLRDWVRILRLGPWMRLRDVLTTRSPVKLARLMTSRGALDEDRARRRTEALIERVGLDRLFDTYLRMWMSGYRKQLDQGHLVHVYDYLTRVPLVLHWPGRLPAGVVRDRMVRQVDLPATVLDLVGIAPPASMVEDGQSLVPLIQGQTFEGKPAYLSVVGQPRDATLRGVRTQRYRYTWGVENPDLPAELYDLQGDLSEQQNIAASQPELCQELAAVANGMVPPGGPRVGRLGDLTIAEQRMLEERLEELGYID